MDRRIKNLSRVLRVCGTREESLKSTVHYCNAFTGITISAPNGDVSITGKNVSIRAGNNLTLESGTNVNYKLWKSKDTTKGTAAQIMLDWQSIQMTTWLLRFSADF